MPKLVIVESPAKAKTISRFLGKEYVVEASYGHVRDLPEKADEIPDAIRKEKWARFGVNIEGDFTPHYVVPASKKKHVERLRKALRGAEELLLATDEDREGESISWHLLELLKPKVPVRRIVFHEITREAIEEALANPRDVDNHLVEAQESRRILDRLYGYSLSPVLWKKVQSGLSAGRVQSVAVRLIVEREEERRAFVTSSYWDLEAEFSSEMGGFKATLSKLDGRRLASGKDFDSSTGQLKSKQAYLLDEKEAQPLAKTLAERLPWKVARVEEKPGQQSPAPPFTTSTLQQEANRKLNMSTDVTMRAAQHLYEGIDLGGGERVGLITYMRTDSTTLSERALGEAQNEIKRMYGAEYARGPRRYKTKSRSAQEAHEAIRPTSLSRLPQDMKPFLRPDEFRVYELIWKRTVASQMPNAEVMRTTVEIAATDDRGRDAVFSASGKKILFPGFLRAYVEGSDDPAADIGDRETLLPDLREGQAIDRANAGPARLERVDAKGHTTSPPARYTEASLVKKLEEEGIGRPSTYASIMSTIQARGYIVKQTKNLVPTFTAMAVMHLMRKHFGDYVDVRFTARMEEELDQIADRKLSWREHVEGFYRGGNGSGGPNGTPGGLSERIAHEESRIDYPAVPIGKDPETGDPLAVKVGRYGPFVLRGEGGEGNVATVPPDVAPADFTPEHAVQLIKARAEGPRELGTDPETGLKVYAARGRFGPYVQLGEAKDKKEKPKRASLPKGMSEEDADLQTALRLLELPRELGKHPETGETILANNGRYGPYVQHQRDFRSLKEGDDVHTVTLERALQLLAEPKGRRGGRTSVKKVLKELGKTEAGDAIQLLDGRYGPYVTDGQVNATIPKGADPESVTTEQARDLIAAKAASGKGRKGAKKATKKAAKKATKKAAKKATKKATKKAAKKPADKNSD